MRHDVSGDAVSHLDHKLNARANDKSAHWRALISADLENNMIRNYSLAVLAAAALLIGSNSVDAQVVPFKVKGGGGTFGQGLSIFGVPVPHNATGNGTSLGEYTGDEGVFQSLGFDAATFSGTFRGRFVFVAANGDRLVSSYGDTSNGASVPGDYYAVPAGNGLFRIVFVAEFNPIVAECTGRYADLVGGSFFMVAMTEPFELTVDANGFTPSFDYSWFGDGYMEYDRD